MIARRLLLVAITIVFAQSVAFAAYDDDDDNDTTGDGDDVSLSGIWIDMDQTTPIIDDYTFHIHGTYQGPEPTDPFPDWSSVALYIYPTSGIMTRAELFMYPEDPTNTNNNSDDDQWVSLGQIQGEYSTANTGRFLISADSSTYTLPQDTDVSFYIKYEDSQSDDPYNSDPFIVRFDNIAPDTPTNIQLAPGDQLIDVTWDRPADNDIAGYYVYWYGQDYVNDEGLMNQALAADVKSENVGYRTDYTIDDLTNSTNIYVSVRAYDHAHNISNFPQPVSDESYDTFGLNLLGDNNEGCFIATAAYGESDPALSVLREFRDSFLKPNILGQLLVAIYYRISPPLADWIAVHPKARAFTRGVLEPIVESAASANRHPLVFTLLFIISLAGLMIFTLVTVSRFRGERR